METQFRSSFAKDVRKHARRDRVARPISPIIIASLYTRVIS